MRPPGRRAWFLAATIVAVVYLAAGLAFGALAGAAPSAVLRSAWRLAAWVVSGAAFLAQIAYEHFRLRNPPRASAWHVSAAAALATLGLAAAANLHPHDAALTGRLRLALVLWPLIVAVPALLVAIVLATGLARTRRGG